MYAFQPFRVALLLAAMAPIAAVAAENTSPPNVLFITVDTLRADHLSAWDYHLETSPNLDKLAAEGARYANAYTVTSRTAPSHFSMFNSRYPQEHGSKLNGFAVPPDSKFVMWPQILRKLGYTNGAFVSAWPLTKRLTKLDAHFDVYDETLNRSYQAINSMRYAEDVAPRAIEWMEKNRKGPFFAWVHLFDPHSPYDFRAGFEPAKATGKPDQTKRRGQESAMANVRAYNSEILYTDHWIGKMVEAIDRMGLKDNTLIVVTADHGESLGERGYQGHSHSLYESVVHVPLIFRMPGKVRAGQVVETKVTLLDLAPTILDLTVKEKLVETRLTTDFVGRSLAANMTAGEMLPDRTVRFVAFSGQKWLMPGWLAKLWLRNLDFPLKFGYRAGDRKVIWTPSKESLEVFDLDDDPFEARSGPGDGKRYEDETEQLAKWFKATHLRQGDNRMDARDREALESLGYLQ